MISIDIDAICTNVIKTGQYSYSYNINLDNEPFKDITIIKNYLCMPIYFNDEIIGILGLANNITDIYNYLKPFCLMLGVLINNYLNTDRIIQNLQSSRFITYHMMEEIFNTVSEGIIVTNNIFTIIYNNKYSNKILNKKNTDINNFVNINLISIFPELNMINNNT